VGQRIGTLISGHKALEKLVLKPVVRVVPSEKALLFATHQNVRYPASLALTL
jgi:hypothetical protein